MQDGDHPKRLFLRRICHQIIPYSKKSYRTIREIRAAVSTMRKRNEPIQSAVKIGDYPVGCSDIVLGNSIPNLVEIFFRFWVKNKPVQELTL